MDSVTGIRRAFGSSGSSRSSKHSPLVNPRAAGFLPAPERRGLRPRVLPGIWSRTGHVTLTPLGTVPIKEAGHRDCYNLDKMSLTTL